MRRRYELSNILDDSSMAITQQSKTPASRCVRGRLVDKCYRSSQALCSRIVPMVKRAAIATSRSTLN